MWGKSVVHDFRRYWMIFVSYTKIAYAKLVQSRENFGSQNR